MVEGRLAGKRILVTGAAGSIGGATATRLAREGAVVVLADRSPPRDRAEAIATTGAARPATLGYDALSAEDSAQLVTNAAEAAGGLDGICNIAGIYAKSHFTDISQDDWSRMLAINLTSTFAICQAAIPHLKVRGGSVVSTSSIAALKGLAYSAAYASAKAGVIALTKSLATEYGSAGIRFNAICPGGVRSTMSAATPVVDADPDLSLRRSKLMAPEGFGEPEDIAAGFAYLLSDDARYVSGSVLVIDGAQRLL